ncbi:MAG: hypothetical protein Q7U47_03685 [Paludibacter sp.]|nr:hypothetical protein [Paludibacter sp.]
MSDELMQQQIKELNQKVDLLLEYVAEQRQKAQVYDDLVDDLTRIGNDVIKTSIKELDDYALEIDMEEVKSLAFRFLRNIETFNSLLSMLQSADDLIKDAYPILKEMIIDFTYEMDKFERAGIFDSLGTISKNLTNPVFLESMARITTIIVNVKPDDQLDNQSIFKLIKEMNSPEVRKSLSYGLRVVKEISK